MRVTCHAHLRGPARPVRDRNKEGWHQLIFFTQCGPIRYHVDAQRGGAQWAAESTMSAARPAGALEPISMIASSRANASIWRWRAAVSSISGARAAAKFSAVQASWMNSGTTFSPNTKLARMIDDTLIMRRATTASSQDTR